MNARELKHMALLGEWKEKVAACRSSGKTVRAWCEEEGIAYKTYYNWEKAVLQEAGRQMARLENGGAGNRFVEIGALPGRGTMTGREPVLAARLRMKSGELELYAGAEAATVEILVQVLRDAE